METSDWTNSLQAHKIWDSREENNLNKIRNNKSSGRYIFRQKRDIDIEKNIGYLKNIIYETNRKQLLQDIYFLYGASNIAKTSVVTELNKFLFIFCSMTCLMKNKTKQNKKTGFDWLNFTY